MSLSRRIPVSNGVLAPSHVENIGPAIWTFLWLIDRTTEEYDAGNNDRRGKVLGGTAITEKAIASELGLGLRTVVRHIQTLEIHRYIRVEKRGRGIAVEVRKSKKWILPVQTEAAGDTPEMADLAPEIRQKRPTSETRDTPKMAEQPDKNGRPRKSRSLLGVLRSKKDMESKATPCCVAESTQLVLEKKTATPKKAKAPPRPAPGATRPPAASTSAQARGWECQLCQRHAASEWQRLHPEKKPLLLTGKARGFINRSLQDVAEADACDFPTAGEALRGYITRFFEDPSDWLVKRGHDLTHLPDCLVRYRDAPGPSTAIEDQSPRVDPSRYIVRDEADRQREMETAEWLRRRKAENEASRHAPGALRIVPPSSEKPLSWAARIALGRQEQAAAEARERGTLA